MWSALACSILSLAVVAAPAPSAPELAPPQETAPRCSGAPALGLPDEPIPQATCTATATCSDGSQLSCTGTGSSPSCSAVDSDCANGVRGFVECNGLRQDCPACLSKKAFCNCRRFDGGWGVWDGSQCALKICIIPVE